MELIGIGVAAQIEISLAVGLSGVISAGLIRKLTTASYR